MVIPIIESIEMLTSSKDLCLIFIKAAEAEGVLGGAAAAGEGLMTGAKARVMTTFPATTAIIVTSHHGPGGTLALR